MKTSLKTGFAQIFSCCPKKYELPKLWGGGGGGGGRPPPSPPPPARTPMKICDVLSIDFCICAACL